MLKIVVLLTYAMMSAAGLGLMKASTTQASIQYAMGFAFYGLAFCIWLFVILPMMPLSIAFPISAGAMVVATILVGQFFLNEPLTVTKIAGSALVIVGITTIFYKN